jgi:YggT family protein
MSLSCKNLRIGPATDPLSPRYHSRVDAIVGGLDAALGVLRVVFLGGAVAAAALCAVDWGVRTRRLQPFSRAARTARQLMAPVIRPVERSVVRAGGSPASAPLWALVAIIVGGIVVLQGLEFIRHQLVSARGAFAFGPRAVADLLIRWSFGVMYIALLIRVVSSWIRVNPFGRFIRWSYTLTEPILAPIRRLIPTVGMIDLSPLVAYFALRVLEWLIRSAL